jgi:hypothetical protein
MLRICAAIRTFPRIKELSFYRLAQRIHRSGAVAAKLGFVNGITHRRVSDDVIDECDLPVQVRPVLAVANLDLDETAWKADAGLPEYFEWARNRS